MTRAKIEDLIGKTLISIDKTEDEIIFKTTEGDAYKMYHEGDCCESVTIEDIIGELDDLLNNPITMAEVITSMSHPEDKQLEDHGSFTWTFYKLATVKGYVTIRWYGTSNGYYSEGVSFKKL